MLSLHLLKNMPKTVGPDSGVSETPTEESEWFEFIRLPVFDREVFIFKKLLSAENLKGGKKNGKG